MKRKREVDIGTLEGLMTNLSLHACEKRRAVPYKLRETNSINNIIQKLSRNGGGRAKRILGSIFSKGCPPLNLRFTSNKNGSYFSLVLDCIMELGLTNKDSEKYIRFVSFLKSHKKVIDNLECSYYFDSDNLCYVIDLYISVSSINSMSKIT